MSLRNCLNPPAAVAAVAELVDLDAYFVSAPGAAVVPYLLVSFAPQANQVDVAVDGVPTNWADDLYITLVADTPGNVEVLRGRVRQDLNPGGRGRALDYGAWLKRADMATPVAPDRSSTKLQETGEYPYYAMDAYRVFSN